MSTAVSRQSSDMNEARERASALRRRFSLTELRRLFITRERDTLFSYVGEPVTSAFAPPHIAVWHGYAIAVGSSYIGEKDEEDSGS